MKHVILTLRKIMFHSWTPVFKTIEVIANSLSLIDKSESLN